MLENWDIITTYTYQKISSGNIVFGIFFLSLICIFVLEENKRIKEIFILYTALFMFIYYFPITSAFILRFGLSEDQIYKMFWILPVVLAISYLLVFWESTLKTPRNKLYFMVAISVFFIIRGSTAYTLAEESESLYRMPSVAIDIADAIRDDAYNNEIDMKRVVVPEELTRFIRQYDASIGILAVEFFQMQNEENKYVSENEKKLFDIARSWNIEAASLERLMKLEEYNYLVLWRYTSGINTLSREFVEIANVSEYVIFRMDSFEINPTVFEGVDYYLVFDYYYYFNRYSDVRESIGENPQELLEHFVTFGMAEGRRGRASFDLEFYMRNYPRLEGAFGDNLTQYYLHYIFFGSSEGRTANILLPLYDEIDYIAIFDFDFFLSKYPEFGEEFDTLDEVLYFFINEGMDEGLQGTRRFDVFYYKENNPDLREKFGDDLRLYYLHFLEEGRFERRPSFDSPVLELRRR